MRTVIAFLRAQRHHRSSLVVSRRPLAVLRLTIVMRPDGLDHFIPAGRQVELSRRQVGVRENPLHVGERDLRVACQAVGRSVPQVVDGPIRPEKIIGAAEHGARKLLAQLPPQERGRSRPLNVQMAGST